VALTEFDMVLADCAPWTAYPNVFGGAGGVTVTVAEAVWVVSAWLAAVNGDGRFWRSRLER